MTLLYLFKYTRTRVITINYGYLSSINWQSQTGKLYHKYFYLEFLYVVNYTNPIGKKISKLHDEEVCCIYRYANNGDALKLSLIPMPVRYTY